MIEEICNQHVIQNERGVLLKPLYYRVIEEREGQLKTIH